MVKKISVIIPCFNEEEIIDRTAKTVQKNISQIGDLYEIIFIDDGSSDHTIDRLRKLSEDNESIQYISFSRNFGKESAMLAGLKECTGDCAVIMDADLQHPPELIAEMVRKYEEGYDQVIARRDRKGDSKRGTFFAKLYYKIVNELVDVQMIDGAGDFRLLSRKAVDAIVSLKENNRFSKGLFS